MYRMTILISALGMAALAGDLGARQGGGPAAPQTTHAAAEPAPTPDAARLWRGTIAYRVTVGADTTGADTAVWAVRDGVLSATDRMHLAGSTAVVESRMSLPGLAPVSDVETRTGATGSIEVRIAYADGRVRGMVSVAGNQAPVDDAAPVGTYDQAALAPVIAALPLRTRAVWTVPAYSPYVRRVTPYHVSVGEVETLPTPMGPVRAYRVTVSGGMAEMLFWFSEAEPRWEVRGEIPALGVKIEPRSRTP
ncbi:MAG TPA: hypothetical protein VFS20_30135 [Longimicrobium sp.]|nr:hypothetical protein [Longimicrobium sp.]